MDIIIAIILGLIQGLTEFLPVSSSGHLALFESIFKTENNLFLAVCLHFGTLISVVVYYFKDLVNLCKPQNHKMVLSLIISCLPAVFVMLLLKDFVSNLFDDTKFLCFGFLITALILFSISLVNKNLIKKQNITHKTALLMGLTQAVAIFPGISRSGSTIFGGVVLGGANGKTSADFSFLMSIPIILGSVVFEFASVNFANINILAIICGVISAFLSGLFAIKIMVKITSKCNFKYFGIYMLIISLITFINSFVYPIW